MNLLELREQIDEIDHSLVSLLEKRMDVSAAIAEYKRKNNTKVLDAAREEQKLDSIRNQCRPETADWLVSVFRSVIAASRHYQETLLEDRRND